MILDLSVLTSGKKEKLEFELEWTFENLDFLSQHSSLGSEPFHVKGQVLRISDEFVLQLDYSGVLRFVCERCLDSLEYATSGKVYKALSTQEDEEDTVVYSDNQLNLIEVVEDDILMNLPIQIKCGQSCKGVCRTCGINLNKETCSCDPEVIDSRLEGLKNFFNNNEEV